MGFSGAAIIFDFPQNEKSSAQLCESSSITARLLFTPHRLEQSERPLRKSLQKKGIRVKSPPLVIDIMVNGWMAVRSARTLAEVFQQQGLVHQLRIGIGGDLSVTLVKKIFSGLKNIVFCRNLADESPPDMVIMVKNQMAVKKINHWEVSGQILKGWSAPVDDSDRVALSTDLGLLLNRNKTIVFGSLEIWDSERTLKIIHDLRRREDGLQFVIVPRRNESLEILLNWLYHAKENFVLYTPGITTLPKFASTLDIYIIDAQGLLITAYALAKVAVIGNTFQIHSGGHNPMEAVAQGAFAVFGPGLGENKMLADFILREGWGAQALSVEQEVEVIAEALKQDLSLIPRKSLDVMQRYMSDVVVPATTPLIHHLNQFRTAT